MPQDDIDKKERREKTNRSKRGAGGAGSKMTPERLKVLFGAIRGGSYRDVAAEYAGIGGSTLDTWIAEGRKALEADNAEDDYAKFLVEFQKAEADASMYHVFNWRKHSEDDWRASMEFLSRRWPEQWSPNRKIELTGKDGGPVQITLNDIVTAMLKAGPGGV